MSKSDKMPDDVRQRVLRLRLQSKLGRGLTAEEQRFCERAWKRWPKDYASTQDEVNEQAMQHVNPFAK